MNDFTNRDLEEISDLGEALLQRLELLAERLEAQLLPPRPHLHVVEGDEDA